MIGMTNASLSDLDSFSPKITTSGQFWISSGSFEDAEGHVGSEAITPPFSQRIDFPEGSFFKGITSSSVPIISMYVPNSITTSTIKEYEKDYGKITKIECFGTQGANDGYLIVTCYSKKPTQDVQVTIKGIL